jgi:tripartite ATP-independent transporter DctM subunit
MGIEPIVLVLLLIFCMIVLLAIGIPLAFSLGGVGLLFLLIFVGPKALVLVYTTIFGMSNDFLLAAIPMYILMGNLLRVSGIAEELYEGMRRWIGTIPGGLAVVTVLICVIFAAMTGMSGPATVTMGLVALPSMLKRGYSKSLAMGTIMGGGTLGILIPPSITMIVFGFMSGASVGKLFIAGILPGMLLATLFIIYILIRCRLQPHLGPPLPNKRFTVKEKVKSLKAVIPLLILVIVILGSIYTGVCTATEAAGIGVGGALILGLIRRGITFKGLKEALTQSFSLTGMVMWIMFGAAMFNVFYMQLGIIEGVVQWVLSANVPPLLIIIGIQLILIIMGMFLDPGGIIIVSAPLFVPIVLALGFDLLWFGILYVINMQMGYLTPPFGMNLFFMRGVAPEGTTMSEIYSAAIPFVFLIAITLLLMMIFPQIPLLLLK